MQFILPLLTLIICVLVATVHAATRKPNVVQVIDEATGEVLYSVRALGRSFQPRVYSTGKHSVRIARTNPTPRLSPASKIDAGRRTIKL